MLRNHIQLNGSKDINSRTKECNRCKENRTISDGVESNQRFICGSCWRKFGAFPRKFGAKK